MNISVLRLLGLRFPCTNHQNVVNLVNATECKNLLTNGTDSVDGCDDMFLFSQEFSQQTF